MSTNPQSPRRAPSPPPPAPQLPAADWEHRALYDRVRETLYSLPAYFRPEIFISGLLATDVFSLNSALGATIEAEVVDALNDLRTTWDPDRKYSAFSFVRRPQTFPDVRLERLRDVGLPEILFGIELKGWYLLAKEGEPSFRFTASPQACAPADLLAVFPWALANVVSGKPELFHPFVVEARFAAERRNYHWEHEMGSDSGERPVVRARSPKPYPDKPDEIDDHARNDSGKNFPRLARTGIMDEYKAMIDKTGISGIPVGLWRKFFKAFVSSDDSDAVDRSISRLVDGLQQGRRSITDVQIQSIRRKLQEIADLLA